MKFVRNWWHIITAIVGVIVSYVSLQGQVNAQADKLQDMKKHGERIARVEAAIEAIPEIRKDIREILRRVR